MVKLICKSRWVVNSLDVQSQVVRVVVNGQGQPLGVVLADGQLAVHAHAAHLALAHEALLRRVEAHHALAANRVAISVCKIYVRTRLSI